MALTPRLELRQGQSLVMTPQLQQAIKLLQFSSVELQEYVEGELSENPMLERDENETGGDDRLAEEHGANEQQDAEPVDEGLADAPELAEGPDDFSGVDQLDGEDISQESVNALDMEEYDNIWERDSAPDAEGTMMASPSGNLGPSDWGNGGSLVFEGRDFGLEQTLSNDVSLRDHLINQVQIDLADPIDRMIAIYLTDQLDEFGRIPDELEAAALRLGCDVERVEEVLHHIQQFDPPGIFARSLEECWAIQLSDKDRLDPAMETLLQNVELLKQHDYKTLTQLCHVDLSDIQDMINEIWALSHNPGEMFEDVVVEPAIPDVSMRRGGEGKWIVELNSDTLPKVLVNQAYYAEISQSVRTKEEKQYVTDKIQTANWLVKSLHQRATTILKVATEIVSQQSAFFEYGVEHLKPLVLRDIAEEIEMHESTVSRVTSNKYIDTPRGIFELKYFFTTAINTTYGGDALSSEAVRYRIRALIDAETPKTILSDDKLVDLLKADGVDIARRTVAKYREAMKIPSSVQRRREKKRQAAFA